MLGRIAAVAVVRMDVRDLANVRPGLRHAHRGRDPVGRLDVGDTEYVLRIGIRLVEQEVGASVGEDRQHAKLFGHGAERRRVAARYDAGEQVDLGIELHPPQLFDVGIGAGRFVGDDGLDLALAQESALGVDLLGGHGVSLERRFTQDCRGAGEEGHVTDLERGVRNPSFCGFYGADQLRARDQAGAREAGPADRYAKGTEKIPTTDARCLVHEVLPGRWQILYLPTPKCCSITTEFFGSA